MSVRCWFVAGCFALAMPAFSQTAQPDPTPARFTHPWTSVSQPNVPADPLEVAGNAEPVHDVSQRATAVKLLNNAQFLSNVRRGPYDLKTQFTSSGEPGKLKIPRPAGTLTVGQSTARVIPP